MLCPLPPRATCDRENVEPVALLPWRRWLLPREHGSWALAFEPVALGLLVAASWAGMMVGIAVAAGFMMRPAWNARTQRKTAPERAIGRRWVVAWSLLGGVALGAAVVLSGPHFLAAFMVGAPLAAWFAWCDGRGDARSLSAEATGAAAFATVPAAMVVAAGGSVSTAVVWSVVMLVRALPTVLVVRATVRRRKGRAGTTAAGLAWLMSAMGAAGLSLWVARGVLPALVAVAAWLLVGRATWLLSPLAVTWTARRIGMAEAGWGFLFLLFAVVGA